MSPAEERQIQEFISRVSGYIDVQKAAEEFCKQAGIDKEANGTAGKSIGALVRMSQKGQGAARLAGRSNVQVPYSHPLPRTKPTAGTPRTSTSGNAPGASRNTSTSQPNTQAAPAARNVLWDAMKQHPGKSIFTGAAATSGLGSALYWGLNGLSDVEVQGGTPAATPGEGTSPQSGSGNSNPWDTHDSKNDPWYARLLRFLLELALRFHYTDF